MNCNNDSIIRKYCILQNPGHNRVYFASSLKLAVNELSVASVKLSSPALNIREAVIGGVEYVTFEKDGDLTLEDLAVISRLSFSYAVFEMAGGHFTPLEKINPYWFDDDLNTILKYSGKTNELFTRMMINIAAFTSGFDYNGNLNLLDPLCGKGTTLFEGLTCGYNVSGVEISDKLVSESAAFFKKYLETKKYKHTLSKEKIHGAKSYKFEFAKNKEDKKIAGQHNLEMICGDTANTGKFYKKNSFHIIVGDLAYGVQHENTAKGNSMRNPADLLRAALPVWLNTLKPRGSVVLAWNTFLIIKRGYGENFQR